jgi:hypothetical protein
VPPNGLEVGDVLAPRDPGQDFAFVRVQVRRDELVNRRADHLGGGVPEDPLGRRIPGENGPVEGLADDGVVRRLDDGGEPRRGQGLGGNWVA